jgi:competence protein ComEA
LFDNVGPREKFAYVILVGAFLALAGYVGAQYLHKPADITFRTGTAPAPAPAEAGATTQPSATSELVVHVAGRVKRAGVYRLAAESRVGEAIAKAGGPEADADLDRLNLAAKVVDGTQIYVPRKGSKPIASIREPEPEPELNRSYAPIRIENPTELVARPERPGPKPLPAAGSVSLNSADSKQLQTLPGVGPATAERIVEYRKEHGRFTAIEELLAVKGIGPKKLEKMRPYLKL